MRCAKSLLMVLSLLSVAVVHAQSVTRATFSALEDVQEMMEAEQYQEAKSALEALVVKTQELPYDFAVANQYLAHTSIILDDTERARTALEAALKVAELPVETRADMNIFYGTLLLGEAEYDLATSVLEEWYAVAERPKPGQIFSVAYANYMNGDVSRAEFLIEQTLALSKEPKESWYQLYYQILFDLKKFESAELVLMGMITRAPSNVAFWRMLVSHYLQLEESSDALASFMVAYNNDLIDRDSDLEQIVTLYGYIDVPDKAARLLEQWIAEGKIPSDADTLKQLGSMWLMARERKNALTVLEKAAALAPDGNTFVMLGGIFFEDENWSKSYSAYQDALSAGGLDDPLRISLLAGISAYQAGNNEDARQALRAAAESDEYRAQAESLLKQLDGR